jgi:polygalacturonase
VVGDGVANDTAGLQAALDALGTSPRGGTLNLPPGTFMTNGLALPENVTIRGSGQMATVLKLRPNAGQVESVITNKKFVTPTADATCCGVRDLTIDGNKGAQGGTADAWQAGILWSNRRPTGSYQFVDSRHVIDHVTVLSTTGTGIVLTGEPGQSTAGANHTTNVQIFACDGFGLNNSSADNYFTHIGSYARGPRRMFPTWGAGMRGGGCCRAEVQTQTRHLPAPRRRRPGTTVAG